MGNFSDRYLAARDIQSSTVNSTTGHIRSFVRREGRITGAQRHAIEQHWEQFGIKFNHAKIDLGKIFHRPAPKVLDIGTGMGEATITLATSHPGNDYLAAEVHRPGIGSLLGQIAANRLTNVRICNHDVIEILQYQIPMNSLDMVYIFFPDPWPKKRHRKRRLISQTLLNLLKPCLKSHARVYIATDWQDYAEHIMEVFAGDSEFINLAGPGRFAPRPHWRPLTKFETRGYKLEHPVRDFVFSCRK
jgi:tRNA (guanine-N7-)-methyltransferase